MNGAGRAFIIAGCVLLVIGVILTLAPKLPTWLGRLPGDISIKRENFSFHFPLMTCLLLSALISFIMWLLRK